MWISWRVLPNRSGGAALHVVPGRAACVRPPSSRCSTGARGQGPTAHASAEPRHLVVELRPFAGDSTPHEMARQRTLGGSEKSVARPQLVLLLRAVRVNCLWIKRPKRGDDARSRRDAALQVLAIYPTVGRLRSTSERFRLLEVGCERHGPGGADSPAGGLAQIRTRLYPGELRRLDQRVEQRRDARPLLGTAPRSDPSVQRPSRSASCSRL